MFDPQLLSQQSQTDLNDLRLGVNAYGNLLASSGKSRVEADASTKTVRIHQLNGEPSFGTPIPVDDAIELSISLEAASRHIQDHALLMQVLDIGQLKAYDSSAEIELYGQVHTITHDRKAIANLAALIAIAAQNLR